MRIHRLWTKVKSLQIPMVIWLADVKVAREKMAWVFEKGMETLCGDAV
jgi:hypothetical protein